MLDIQVDPLFVQIVISVMTQKSLGSQEPGCFRTLLPEQWDILRDIYRE